MEARDPSSPSHRALATLGAIAAALGGAVAWALVLFAGVGDISFAIGAVATVGALVVLAAATAKTRWLPRMLGYANAFVLLTWPLLGFVLGMVRYLLTGQTLGE